MSELIETRIAEASSELGCAKLLMGNHPRQAAGHCLSAIVNLCNAANARDGILDPGALPDTLFVSTTRTQLVASLAGCQAISGGEVESAAVGEFVRKTVDFADDFARDVERYHGRAPAPSMS